MYHLYTPKLLKKCLKMGGGSDVVVYSLFIIVTPVASEGVWMLGH